MTTPPQTLRFLRALLVTSLILAAIVTAWLALMFGWLTATPGDPAPRKLAFAILCPASPLCLIFAAIAIGWRNSLKQR